MIANQLADFFVRSAVTETTRSYMGGLMTFLVSSAETENRFLLLEIRTQPGAEPPPHLHYEQDEVFYILEGELEVYCMGQVRTVRAGETVFLPRMQAHAFYFLSPIRFLALVQPGGLDGYFEAMSSPATSMEVPTNAATYADSDPASALAKLNEVIELAAKYRVKFLTPAETAELLPHYPGFGVPREARSH
ncbi:cupin domain-containing protein [Chroococcidiopsis sp. FACHB-1243]|uniref:cupin domain-containing protein n=1 Tax=Chroococcidiopsis sp. [FACHB-1243] TaxID=2692781 RepID=UPI001784D052|nr:cupin domain-containing protein [Chroococcidiopsis sp. [FACHB-1243]]MBD2309967.1 cupin domain-containing protein [Chroococcidiopsis sp. [FACHB-1243]]